jgi:hypothetical protein
LLLLRAQSPNRGRLPRPVGSEKPEHVARRDSEGHVLEGRALAETLGEAVDPKGRTSVGSRIVRMSSFRHFDHYSQGQTLRTALLGRPRCTSVNTTELDGRSLQAD